MRIEDTILNDAFMVVSQHHDGLGGIGEYQQVVEHIAGGEKLLPARVPADLAESRRMRSEISGMSQAVSNVQEAAAIAGIAGETLGRVAPVLGRMNELAARAAASGCGDAERGELDAEYRQLVEQLSGMVEGASFNDVPIFDGTHSRDNGGLIMQAGGTGQVIAMYFEGPDMKGLAAGSLKTRGEAEQAASLVARQMQVFSRERAGLSEYNREISGQRQELEGMIAALPETEKRLQDGAEAGELAARVAEQLVSRPAAAITAQCLGIKRENAGAALYD